MTESEYERHQSQCEKLFDAKIKALLIKISGVEKVSETHIKEIKDSIILAKSDLDYRLRGMNEFQKRMDRLESTFVTRDVMEKLEKIVYTGLGIVLAIQFFFGIMLTIGGWGVK
jgi:hypothetical protein